MSNFAALVAEALAKGFDAILEVIPAERLHPEPLINLHIYRNLGTGNRTEQVFDSHTADSAELDVLILQAREAVRRAS